MSDTCPPRRDYPLVVCLCPTYGRFQCLREALACFLAQDYPNKQLIILNDAEVQISPADDCPNVHILNLRPFLNLGAKRQALLEEAIPFCNQAEACPPRRGTEMPRFCAHWDDDDLYLPWHLSSCVRALQEHPEATCVQPHGAWYLPTVAGMPDREVHGIHHNVFEGQIVFDRERALELGGYPAKHSGQARALMKKFHEAGEFKKFEPWPGPSYVYRWDQSIGHISAIGESGKGLFEGKNATALERFQDRNTDFGDGQPLTPADLAPCWSAVLESARKELSKDDYVAFEQRLNATEPQRSQRKEKTHA